MTNTQAPATAEGPTQHTQNQAPPTIHQAMALVMRDVRNVEKNGRNNSQNYSFRGVDDAIAALAQPLRDHGVFMTPEVLDCESESRGKMNAVRMRVAFHFYGPAGDSVRAVTMGEASDVADKASNKAMSAALKYALIHTFMIPVDAKSLDDGDRDHPVGHRSPADTYMERLRKPMVWNNPSALAAMHAEVKADGLLNAMVQGPDGETTLGELIVARGKSLKEAAAEREAQRTEEAPKAAAQVAAEHGVAQPPAESGPAPGAAETAVQQGGLAEDEMLDKLFLQAIANRSNVGVLEQIIAGAKQERVIERMVDGPPPARERMTFGALLDLLLADAQAMSQERNAA
ncbi:ERF family protein [Streptomyces angustmyceticus]|uniref:ERF family protein n=1 Tax=Streptomyces angustmyceticus TaxID=285578 RepID=UPI003686959A